MKYIYIVYRFSTWTLKHTFHWILQPCITGQTSQCPFDWSVPPMMSGSCSGIREGYAGASRSNVQHLHSQDGWHYVRLVHSVLFSGDLGREHTWQSPGHSVLASKPFYHQSPEYPVVCSSDLLVSQQCLQIPINLRCCNQPRSQAPEQNCLSLLSASLVSRRQIWGGRLLWTFLFLLWRYEDISPSTFQLPSPTTDLRWWLVLISHICHESHENSRVNFFWPV